MINISVSWHEVKNIEVKANDISETCAEIVYALSLIYGRLCLDDKKKAEQFKRLLCRSIEYGEDRFFTSAPAEIVQNEFADEVKVVIGE